MKFDPLHYFISPVTGKLLVEKGYILVGDKNGHSYPSPILIDVRQDIIDLRRSVGSLKELEKLDHNKIWIGDYTREPVATLQVGVINLPTLGAATFPYPDIIPLPAVPIPNPTFNPFSGLDWLMSGPWLPQVFAGSTNTLNTSSETVISSSLAMTQVNVAQAIKRLDVTGFIVKNRTIDFSWENPATALLPTTIKDLYGLNTSHTFTNAQALDEIGAGLLHNDASGNLSKATLSFGAVWAGSLLEEPTESFTYVQGPILPAIPGNIAIWSIALTPNGRAIADSEIPVSAIVTLQEEVSVLQGEVATLQTEVTTIQGQVSALETTVGGLVTDVAALDADVVAINLEIDAIQLELIGINLEIDGILLSISTIEGEIVTLQGQITTIEASIVTITSSITTLQAAVAVNTAAITAVNLRVDNLRLNTISASGDVSFYNYKLINLAAGTNPTDGINLSQLTAAIAGIGTITQYSVLAGGASNTIISIGAVAAGRILQSGGVAANPAYSTATYPATTTINQLLYSSATNTVAGLATATNGVLITDGAGVPSFSTLPPSSITGYPTDTSKFLRGDGAWTNSLIGTTSAGVKFSLNATDATAFSGINFNEGVTINFQLGYNNDLNFASILSDTSINFYTGGSLVAPKLVINSVGNIITGVWNATPIAVLNGGTGATTAAAARTNLGLTGVATSTTTLNAVQVGGSGDTITSLPVATNGVLVTNGAGAPSISSTLPTAVQGNITSLGTVATGIWNGSPISANYISGYPNNTNTFLRGDGAWTNTLGGVPVAQPTILTLFNLYSTTQLQSRLALTGAEFYQAGNSSTEGIGIQIGVNRTNNRQVWITDTALPRNTTNALFRIIVAGTTCNIGSLSTDGTTLLPLEIGGSQIKLGNVVYLQNTTANRLLFSSGNNTISEITTANNGILITSAAGVPSISSTLPAAVQGNITSLGTIATGIWNGTTIAVLNGGTGATTATAARTNLGLTAVATQSITQNSILEGGASNSITSRALTNGQLLIGNTGNAATAALPTNGTNISWVGGAGTLTANLSGQVAVVNGGTGATTAATARTNLAAAPLNATYIVQTANTELANEQVLGALATGILKNTTGTGVLTVATAGTDYYSAGNPITIYANPNNLFAGYLCGNTTYTSVGNTGWGNYNLLNLTSGQGNSAFGGSSLRNLTSSNYNTGGGFQTLWQITALSHLNTAYGYAAGSTRLNYSQCTFLGGYSDATVEGLINSTAVGANTLVSLNNSVVLGNNCNVGIGDSNTSLAGLIISNRGPFDASGDQTCLLLNASAGNGAKLLLQAYTGGAAVINKRADGVLYISNSYTITLDSTKFAISGAVAQKLSGNVWSNPSDARIKNVVRNYDKGISELLKIQPKVFTFNELSGASKKDRKKENIGIIAQEIEEFLPECISISKSKTDKVKDMRIYDANAITYLLINSVKQLYAELNNLKQQLTQQREQYV